MRHGADPAEQPAAFQPFDFGVETVSPAICPTSLHGPSLRWLNPDEARTVTLGNVAHRSDLAPKPDSCGLPRGRLDRAALAHPGFGLGCTRRGLERWPCQALA